MTIRHTRFRTPRDIRRGKDESVKDYKNRLEQRKDVEAEIPRLLQEGSHPITRGQTVIVTGGEAHLAFTAAGIPNFGIKPEKISSDRPRIVVETDRVAGKGKRRRKEIVVNVLEFEGNPSRHSPER
jgi:hypothetical protein